MTVLCLGKLSKLLDLESYLSPAIGASSRKLGSKSFKNYHVPHYYGQNLANATGGPQVHTRTFGDSVEELPLRTRSKNGDSRSLEGDSELSDAITVKRDVIVRSERGRPDNSAPPTFHGS